MRSSPRPSHSKAVEALYGPVVVLQQQQSASSLSPSLRPSLLLEPELHSSPLRSIHTQGAAGERAEPLRDQCGNVPKFWNLKPWRGYLPRGSPEPVSSPKTPERGSFGAEGAVFGGKCCAYIFFPFCICTVWRVRSLCVCVCACAFSPCGSSTSLKRGGGSLGGAPKPGVKSRAEDL